MRRWEVVTKRVDPTTLSEKKKRGELGITNPDFSIDVQIKFFIVYTESPTPKIKDKTKI